MDYYFYRLKELQLFIESLGDLAKNLLLTLIFGYIVFKSYTKGGRDAEKSVPNKKWLSDNIGSIVGIPVIVAIIVAGYLVSDSVVVEGVPVTVVQKSLTVCFILGNILIPYICGQLLYRDKNAFEKRIKEEEDWQERERNRR